MGLIIGWCLLGLISMILICKFAETDVALTDLVAGICGGVMTFIALIFVYLETKGGVDKKIILFSFKKKKDDEDKKQLLKD